MAGEEQRKIDNDFTRRVSRRSEALDLLDRHLRPTPAALSGLAGDETQSSEDKALMKALRRQGAFNATGFNALNTGATMIRPQESRTYLFIQNLAAAGNLLVGFGWIPTSAFAVIITPGSAYEPFTVPTNEIYVLGSAASVAGMILFAVDGEI